MTTPRTVAVLGASGNVGRRVVARLLAAHRDALAAMITINRRVVDELFEDDPRVVHHVVAMEDVQLFESACDDILAGVTDIVATMGLGSGKGSVDQFRRVEVDIPSAFARAAAKAQAQRATLLTAAGADEALTFSWLLPHVARGKYFHFKGLVERNFAEAGFADGVTVFRPAGLLGTDHLPAVVDRIVPALDYITPAHWHCIHIDKLAGAIARIVLNPSTGDSPRVLQGEQLFALLDGPRKEPDA